MSLQSRLFAFFMAIVVLPLAVASGLGQRVISRELERRTYAQLLPAGGAATAIYQQRVDTVQDRVRLMASGEEFQRLLLEGNYLGLRGHVEAMLGDLEGVDYLIVTDGEGNLLTEFFTPADFLRGIDPPTAAEILAAGPENPRGLLATRGVVPIRSVDDDALLANILGGEYLDIPFVRALAEPTGSDITLLLNQRVVASTLDSAEGAIGPVTVSLREKDPGTPLKTEIAGEAVYGAPAPLAAEVPTTTLAFLISTPQAQIAQVIEGMNTSMILLLVLAVVAAALFGYFLTRGITRPLRDLSAGANAIAAGNYDQNIAARSRDEIGMLARAFNEMAARLAEHIAELNKSREDLKRALTRFGQTLRSTHDMDQLLNDVVETSMDYLRATAGMLLLVTPSRDRLRVSVARGVDQTSFELKLGEGVAGYVAESGNPVRVPDGSLAAPAAQEPSFRTALAVPIFSQERIAGVLCLYDKEEEQHFTEGDMAGLLSLADSAGVAIENVLLHDEARRLSIVDTVVGIWNRRYFQLRFEQELERSARFGRPFSLLLIDIDDFKVVNDTHGHQRGDSVLIELARRINDTIREIDVFARFGGEEFVLILPETDAQGGVATAEKIRSIIAGQPFDGDTPLQITVSVGVSCYWEHGRDQESLIRAADTAMYEAKHQKGKNTVVLYKAQEGVGSPH